MIRGDLAKLLRLRRHREDKAMNVVLVRGATLARAEQDMAVAKQAVVDHANHARDHERQSLGRLLGRTLHPHDLANLQSDLNARADQREDLLAAEQQAIAQRESCQSSLNDARSAFRKRHAQAEKLSALIVQEQQKDDRNQLIVAESATDEGHLGTAQATEGSGDA